MKNAAIHESKSLKTFYLYACIVAILICISLTVKVFFIFQQSLFDPSHDFTVAVLKNKNVKEILAFHTQTPTLEVLMIHDNKIPYDSLAKNYGIAANAYIQPDSDAQLGSDVTTFFWSSILHTATWQTNLTLVDKIRLLLLAKNVTPNNKTVDDISLQNPGPEVNTILSSAFIDQDIATENISIQIINATNIAGFGQRLGRVLTTLGANVVDISTAQNTQGKSTIAYYGNSSYTAQSLEKLLRLSATRMNKQTIANIVITLGTDKSNTIEF